jgi:hypothetical protein
VKETVNPADYQVLAVLVAIACLCAVVDGALQQMQMFLLGGNMLAGNSVPKAALLVAVLVGCVLYPRIDIARIPILIWGFSIGFLLLEIVYLDIWRGMSLSNILLSYYDYYGMLLIGPVLLVFRGALSEKKLVLSIAVILLVCVIIGAAQHFLGRPILYTESSDGSFTVPSWEFIGSVRAFSLFGSALEFGLFSALCGALGIALAKTRRLAGILLLVIAAFGCFTTLTRLCYLIFVCACLTAFILTFGKKPNRGTWQPLMHFVLGILTLLAGVSTLAGGGTSDLQDTGSLFMRLDQWSYYYNLLAQATWAERMFGFGIVQNEKILPRFPMIIDNTPLALILHIGVIGLLLFSFLSLKMWLYLRHEAAGSRQPLVVAVASLWATMACAGIFNIVFSSFGAVFALAILCRKKEPQGA